MSMLSMFISDWCVKNICSTRFAVQIVVKLFSFGASTDVRKFKSLISLASNKIWDSVGLLKKQLILY